LIPYTAGRLTLVSDIEPPQHHPVTGMHSWVNKISLELELELYTST
jgi:hypothetical protein